MIEHLYRLKEVIGDPKNGVPGIIPVSQAAWFDGIAKGLYPAGVKLGARTVAWRQSDLEKLQERIFAGNIKTENVGL
jgi:hypothetical protein